MFLAVVESGTYAVAGERLHLSHSAIHRQVRLLEHELSDRLFVRFGGRMKLTNTGKIVVEHARRIRQQVVNLRRQIDDAAQLQTGHLCIGTGTMMLQFFLPPVIKRFRQEFPGIDLHLMTGTAQKVIEKMKGGQLDLGIIFSPVKHRTERDAFSYEPLYREEFVWVVSKTHPLAKRKTAPLAQILEFPLISLSETSYVRRLFEHVLERAQVKPKIIMELESEESMGKMAEINMGIAFLARRRAVNDKIRYIRNSEGPIHCEVGIILPKIDYIPAVVKQFARMCREAASAW